MEFLNFLLENKAIISMTITGMTLMLLGMFGIVLKQRKRIRRLMIEKSEVIQLALDAERKAGIEL